MDYWKTADSLSEEKKACPNCGALVGDGKKFCSQCGWKLEASLNKILELNDREALSRLWDQGTGFSVSMQHVDGRVGDKRVGIFEEIRVFPKERLAINRGQSTLSPEPKISAKQLPAEVTSVDALLHWLTCCGWPVCFRNLEEMEKRMLGNALSGNGDVLVMSKRQAASSADADSGPFFADARKQIKKGHIKNALLFLLLACVFGTIVVFTGFSPDMEWQIGLRYSELGIPLPNWLISSVALLFCLGSVIFLITNIKGAFTCEEYNSLLEAAKAFGNVQAVGQHLQKLPRNALTKKNGHLRFDKDIFFYQKGEDVWLFPTRSISNIRPVQKDHGSSSDYYVEISQQGKIIQLDTKKKNMLPLANEILAAAKQAAGR